MVPDVYFLRVEDLERHALEISASVYDVEVPVDDESVGLDVGEIPRRMMSVATRGDGACGVNAIWGKPGESRELVLPHARYLAAHLMGPSAESLLEAGVSQRSVEAISESLWGEFLVLHFRGDVSVESHCFWQELSPQLAREARRSYDANIRAEAGRNEVERELNEECRVFPTRLGRAFRPASSCAVWMFAAERGRTKLKSGRAASLRAEKSRLQ